MPKSDSALHLAVICLLATGADVLDDKGAPKLAYTLSYGIGFVFETATRAMICALLKAGQSLVDDANGRVTAGLEANEAHALAKMPGVK